MRVRGRGYWIGGGLGALGLIGLFLWVSMVSARPDSRIMIPDEPSDSAVDNVTEPSVVAETAGERQPQSRILRVGTDGTEPDVEGSGGESPGDVDIGNEDPDTSTSTVRASKAGASTTETSTTEATAAGATAEPDHTGGTMDKPIPVDDGASTPRPEAGSQRNATSTMATLRERSTTTTTAKPTTHTTAGRTTTKPPTTSATASSTTRPPTTAKPATTKPPTTATTSGGGGNQSMEQQVIELTNDTRRQAGCPALVHNDKLRLAAYLHSKDMSDNDYFSHTGLDGSSPGDRIARQGYQFRGWAENIAWGYRSPAAVVEGWMNSAGHRANILNCSLTEIGVGFHNSYWTQKFGIHR